MIYVVGLGCTKGQITQEGIKAIDKCKTVFVKTAKTDTYKYFEESGKQVQTMDDIYEQSEDFEQLDRDIVERILGAKGNVCYCVNGSGYDDRSVALLAQKAEIKLIPGVSRAVVNGGFSTGATYISAYELLSLRSFDYDTRLPLVVTDIDNKYTCSEVKLLLANLVGDDTEVYLSGEKMPLSQIDYGKKFNYATTLRIPAMQMLAKQRFNFGDVVEVLRRLRDEDGCKWDRAQTHDSIRSNLVEEAYELVDAINNSDIDNMIEETGDVLLQSVFHAQIGEDEGEYNLQDVMTMLCRKLIDRHPHVFGDVVANTAEEGLQSWEKAKAKEKHYKSYTDKMDKIARTLPALMRAYKIQKTAGKAGMDFGNIKEAEDKIIEELNELKNADLSQREDEGGDLLFSAVNVLRLYKQDPELALIRSTEKFAKRFCKVESMCDRDMKEYSPEELDKLWEQAKNED